MNHCGKHGWYGDGRKHCPECSAIAFVWAVCLLLLGTITVCIGLRILGVMYF